MSMTNSFLLILIATLLSFGCQKKDKTTSEEVNTKIERFKESMEEQLDDIDEKIDELEVRIENETEDSREALKEKVNRLKSERDTLKDRLNSLGENASEKFSLAKEEIRKSFNKLKNQVEEALE